MGHPKFTRRKYITPSHPWENERIQAENELVKQFGLKNKKEVWKANSQLRKMRRQARRIIAQTGTESKQIDREMNQQISRQARIGLLEPDARIDDLLTVEVGTLLSRRLQTVVYHKGLARTPRQARQLIGHGHIAMGGRIVRTPSMMVPKKLEDSITFSEFSPLEDEEHPMRVKPGYSEDTPEEPEAPERKSRPRDDKREKGGSKETKKEPPKGQPAKDAPAKAPAEPESKPKASAEAKEAKPEKATKEA